MTRLEMWMLTALVAFGLTVATLVFSEIKHRAHRGAVEEPKLANLILIFVGFFTAISIGWGIVEMIDTGYGDGYIF